MSLILLGRIQNPNPSFQSKHLLRIYSEMMLEHLRHKPITYKESSAGLPPLTVLTVVWFVIPTSQMEKLRHRKLMVLPVV